MYLVVAAVFKTVEPENLGLAGSIPVHLRSPGKTRPGEQVGCPAEVSGHLVGSPAFKAGEAGDPSLAGSIPVHLRQCRPGGGRFRGTVGWGA